ncbi:hypothetical protein [Rugosimonospora africana]|uniref:Peptidase inhibitor family I36 n=1 Tax=Rugosimonospora africana TaxID=556532 RepID=A0A8J3QVN6_9ACTN|nr:hypothetical protein [Rugosimonospora africana]GIH17234.1 hypothetical protein Raf01_54060 [Rugosimonospora africana]
MLRTRAARVVAGVVIATTAAVAPMMTASPANAASKHIGVHGNELRCWGDGGVLCLYYNHTMTTGAFWGTAVNDSDLYNDKFWGGTGTGAGQVVKNNATAMSCSWYASQCFSYYNHGYAGNYDWEYGNEIGQLSYTWNNDASVEVITCGELSSC